MASKSDSLCSRREVLLGLAPIVGLALALRAVIDFATPLLPKVNGAYYPVQVRALLQSGRLAFADFPLVFWLEAGLAKLLMACGVQPPQAILWACKGVDTVLPALAAIPAFLIARRWSVARGGGTLPAVVAASFAVLYFPAVVLTADCHKNAVGLVLFFLFAFSVQGLAQQWRLRTALLALGALGAVGLTHIGAFGVTLAFALLASITVGVLGVLAIFAARRASVLPPKCPASSTDSSTATITGSAISRRALVRSGAAIAGLMSLLGASVLLADHSRVKRLMGLLAAPFRLFERPIIVEALNGHAGSYSGPGWAHLVLINGLAMAALVVLVKRWRSLSRATQIVGVAAIGLSLLLASPLLGRAYAQRLLLMAHAPAAIAVAFLLTHLRHRPLRRILAPALLVIAVLSGVIIVPRASRPAISPASWSELKRMRCDLDRRGLLARKTLVVARHGLEWWTAWVLGTHVVQARRVKAGAWRRYAQVLALRQIRGGAPFGPGGPTGGAPFPEARTPPGSTVLWRGHHFVLVRLAAPADSEATPRW